MKRITRTVAAGGGGYLAGLLVERGLESVIGLDFVDGVMAVGGAVLSAAYVNKDIVAAAADNIRDMFGKDPLDLTQDEWNQYKDQNPQTAKILEKALHV